MSLAHEQNRPFKLLTSPPSFAHVVMKAIGDALAVLPTAGFMLILFNFVLMIWQGLMITAVSQYENVLEHRWHRSDLIEHFPYSIPVEAQNVRFHYNAGFLQGGAAIELRARLPAEVVEDVEKTYRPQAKGVFNATGDPAGSDEEAGVLPKLSFYTVLPSEQSTALPSDFETLLLWSSEPLNLNHPKGAGISISRQRGEVIYWAEDG